MFGLVMFGLGFLAGTASMILCLALAQAADRGDEDDLL